MSLSFRYTTTLTDYEHFDQARLNYLTAGDVNRNRQFSERIYGLIFILLFLAMVTILAAAVQVSFSIFSFVLGIVFYIFMTAYKVRRIRNKLTPRPDCSLFGEYEMLLDESTFVVKTATSTTRTDWQVVSEVQENADYFFIFLDSLRGFYIPKQQLNSEELVTAVRIFLNDKVKT